MASKVEADLIARNQDLEQALTRTQRALAKERDKQGALVEAVYQAARDGFTAAGPVKPPAAVKARKGKPEVALLHLTDWQLGKRTTDYDSDVCVDRVMRCVSKTVSITRIQRSAHPVDEVHVMLGGDLVEGVQIFPGQVFEVDSSAMTQVFTAARLVADALAVLLTEFKRVVVWEVYGNHGRMGRKGDYPREDNLDRMVCELARAHSKSQRRLEWRTPLHWYNLVQVGDYRALLVHGDQIKSFGGNTPAFGIMRKATAWSTGVVPDHTDVYLGHFHQAMTLTKPSRGRVFMTPSVESSSAYAQEFVAATGQPGQRLHFVDPVRGRVTAEYLLEVQ